MNTSNIPPMPSFSPSTWRLLITEPASGAWNMAVDEAIATLAAQGESPPTLRFYQWQPGTVSLGRHQSAAEIDSDRLQAQGYDLVRRPTGGRAILHIDELTYSIMGPANEPRLHGPVLDTYNLISQGIVLGLRRMGVAVSKAPGDQRVGPDVSPVCFEAPSAYEISVGRQKLVGSAQNRRAGYVLQHGTLPLQGDITRLVDVLAIASEAERTALREILAARATTLGAVLGRVVTFWEAATALIDGLSTVLALDFEQQELSPAEQQLAQTLVQEKYVHPDWLQRVS